MLTILKELFTPFATWMRRRTVWLVLAPYLIASCLSTFPSREGVAFMFLEWAMFGFVLAAWRVGGKP